MEGGILELPWQSFRLSVRGHNFVQSFSPTVLHILLWNLYIMIVYISSCACAIFMTILSLVVELSSLELVDFTELLLSIEIILQYCMYWTRKLHTMLLVVYSSACAIFITILSLVAELSPLELVNFTKSLLSRALPLQFCKYCSEIYTLCLCVYEVVHMQFSRPYYHWLPTYLPFTLWIWLNYCNLTLSV